MNINYDNLKNDFRSLIIIAKRNIKNLDIYLLKNFTTSCLGTSIYNQTSSKLLVVNPNYMLQYKFCCYIVELKTNEAVLNYQISYLRYHLMFVLIRFLYVITVM